MMLENNEAKVARRERVQLPDVTELVEKLNKKFLSTQIQLDTVKRDGRNCHRITIQNKGLIDLNYPKYADEFLDNREALIFLEGFGCVKWTTELSSITTPTKKLSFWETIKANTIIFMDKCFIK